MYLNRDIVSMTNCPSRGHLGKPVNGGTHPGIRFFLFGASSLKLVPFFLAIINLDVSPSLSALMLAVFMLFDMIDGALFRRSTLKEDEQFRQYRQVYDVILDRIAIQAVALVMVFLNDFPVIVYSVILLREGLLIGIVIRHFWIHGEISKPNWSSRLGTLTIGLIAMTWLVGGSMDLVSLLLVMMVLLSVKGNITYRVGGSSGGKPWPKNQTPGQIALS